MLTSSTRSVRGAARKEHAQQGRRFSNSSARTSSSCSRGHSVAETDAVRTRLALLSDVRGLSGSSANARRSLVGRLSPPRSSRSSSDAALSPPLFFFLVRRVALERTHQQQRRRALATVAQSACTATAATRRGEGPLAWQAVGLVPAAVRRQRRLRLLVRRLDSPAKTTAPRSRGRAPLARPADDQEQPRPVRRHRRRHPPRPPRRLCALQVLLLERQLADDGQRQRRRDERKGRHGHADVVGRCRDDDRVDRGGAGDGRGQ